MIQSSAERGAETAWVGPSGHGVSVPPVRRRRTEDLPAWRRVRRWLFYALARALAAGARVLPRPVAAGWMEGLGWLAWAIRRRERRRAGQRLSWAFPDWSERRRRRVLRRSYLLFGRNLVDAVREDVEVTIGPADRRRWEEAIADGRPLLLLTAHLGCWEQLGRWLARTLPAVGTVTADPHNRRVDRWLRRERSKLGITTFDRRREPLAAARWLRGGRPLAILADHRNQVRSVSAPWFGRPAPTAVGPARLARRAGALILPVGIHRRGRGHEVLVGRSVDWSPGDDDAVIAAACNRALEELVRRAPEEWTWFHERYRGP